MNFRARGRVLDCASPLALLDPPELRKPKRQRTGAVQDLAALRRFRESFHDLEMAHWDHEPRGNAHEFKAFRDSTEIISGRCESLGELPRFMESFHLPSHAHRDHDLPSAQERLGLRQSSGAFRLARSAKAKAPEDWRSPRPGSPEEGHGEGEGNARVSGRGFGTRDSGRRRAALSRSRVQGSGFA